MSDLYDALAAGDMGRLTDGLADDVAWTEADGFPYAGTYHGPDAVVENVFVPLGTDWERFDAEVDELVVDGDTVVGVGTYRGTHGETGADFAARFAHVWEVADGEVTRFEQIADTVQVQAAMES